MQRAPKQNITDGFIADDLDFVFEKVQNENSPSNQEVDKEEIEEPKEGEEKGEDEEIP